MFSDHGSLYAPGYAPNPNDSPDQHSDIVSFIKFFNRSINHQKNADIGVSDVREVGGELFGWLLIDLQS